MKTQDEANAEYHKAYAAFDAVRKAFRAGQVSAEVFCEARREFNSALAEWEKWESEYIAAH